MRKLELLAQADPAVAVKAHSVIARIFADSHRPSEALQVYKAALEQFADNQYIEQIPSVRYSYATLLKETGKNEQAAEQFDIVAKTCRQMLDEKPNSVEPYSLLGNVAAENGDFVTAVEHFRKTVDLQPDNTENHMTLIQAFEAGGKLDEAIQAAQAAIEYFQTSNRTKDADTIRQYLSRLQGQKVNK